MMKPYELVVMFPVDKNDVSAEKSITEKCKKHGLSVVSLDKWGVKTLSYPIKKQTKAYYLKYDLSGEPESIKKLEVDLRNEEAIVRYLIVNVAKAPKKTVVKDVKKEK